MDLLVGNLTRDIELKYVQGGMAIAKSAIATSRKFKSNTGEQKEEICFVDITFFGRSAEVANQYICKGSKILVEGRLSFDQWTDQNGQKRSKHGVNVDVMQMLDSKGSNTNATEPRPISHQEPSIYMPQQAPAHTYNKPVQNKQYNSSTIIDDKIMSDIDEMDEKPPF